MTRHKTKTPWSAQTELVGLVLTLKPFQDCTLYPQCAIALHAWFLDQVRQLDPQLSAAMHDGEAEKPFTLSRLEGITKSAAGAPKLRAEQS